MKTINVLYKNWKGNERLRKITPIGLIWGMTEWHPKEQWLLRCRDEDGEIKDFALEDCDFRMGR